MKALPGPLAGTLADDPTDPSVAFMPGECRCCSWQHAPKDRAPEPIGPPTAWRPAHEQAEAHVRKLTK